MKRPTLPSCQAVGEWILSTPFSVLVRRRDLEEKRARSVDADDAGFGEGTLSRKGRTLI